MEFIVAYILPILIMVADYFLTKTDKIKSNSFLEMAIKFGIEVANFFIKKDKPEDKK